MADLKHEPQGTRILNELAEFAERNPQLSGFQVRTLADGRVIEIRVRPHESRGDND